MENFEEINAILMESIRNLKNLDVENEKTRDEIMKGNAIQQTAKTIIQLQILKLAKEKQEKRIFVNGTNMLVE